MGDLSSSLFCGTSNNGGVGDFSSTLFTSNNGVVGDFSSTLFCGSSNNGVVGDFSSTLFCVTSSPLLATKIARRIIDKRYRE